MEFSAKQIAEFLSGIVVGDESVRVSDFAKIEEGKPGKISFLANPKYEPHIYTTQSSIVLVNDDFVPSSPVTPTLVKVKNAYAAIAQLLRMAEQANPRKEGIDSLASIDTTAAVGEGCYVGAFAVVSKNVTVGEKCQIYPHVFLGDRVKVGKNVIIYPHVSVYHDCEIGDHCILHSGAVIGADGFGFAPEGDEYKKIPQLGNVVLEEQVEVGANSTVDRATMGSTRVKKGVKIDNLVQLAHNTEVGENTVMAAQSGIAGSTKLGRNCVIGGQVGLAGHISIGNRVQIAAQSGIHTNVEDGAILFGSPAVPAKQAFRMLGYYRRLPEMNAAINELKKEIEALKKASNK